MGMEVEQLIKIILGVLVFVAVVVGLYFFIKYYAIDFFKNLGPDKINQIAKIILSLI